MTTFCLDIVAVHTQWAAVCGESGALWWSAAGVGSSGSGIGVLPHFVVFLPVSVNIVTLSLFQRHSLAYWRPDLVIVLLNQYVLVFFLLHFLLFALKIFEQPELLFLKVFLGFLELLRDVYLLVELQSFFEALTAQGSSF